MAWVADDDPNVRRCALHNQVFGPLETCALCSASPTDVAMSYVDSDITEEPEPPPTGCNTSEDHEREFCRLADLAEAWASTCENVNTQAKLLDAALKARRAASSMARAREDLALMLRLERRRRALNAIGRH